MATAKKTPAKTAKPPAKAAKPVAKAKAPVAAKKAPKEDEQFRMPVEVRDWIDQASSRMKNMQSKIDRLEEENKSLKTYKKWAEHRIMGTSHE